MWNTVTDQSLITGRGGYRIGTGQVEKDIELYTSRDLIFSHSNLYAKVSRISIDPIKFRVDLLVYIY